MGATPTLLVEVKAHAEQLDVPSPYLARLLETAHDASRYGDYQPVLIASFIDARAQSFCKAAGIAVHELGRQIIQRKDRATARELWADADKIFQYVRIERPFADLASMDPRSKHDIEKFRSRTWIEQAHRQWRRLTPVRHRILAPLFEEDWNTLRVLLPDYDQAA